jgi:hypothetical protein
MRSRLHHNADPPVITIPVVPTDSVYGAPLAQAEGFER